MPSLEVTGQMGNSHIGSQVWAVEGSRDQVVETGLCSGNNLAADVAPATIAVIDGLRINRFAGCSPLSGYSAKSLLADLVGMCLAVASLYFGHCIRMGLAPLCRICPHSLYEIGRIPSCLKLPPDVSSLFRMSFAPTLHRLSRTSASGFGISCIALPSIVGVFSRPATPIGECPFGMFGTPTCLILALVFAQFVAVCFVPTLLRCTGVFVRHNNAAFPGTASSYLTAPVRAA